MSHHTFVTDGLLSDVNILIDKYGVAHISASNTSDLFFAQGYNAARARLFQLDLWRKRGLGILSKELGPGFLLQDRRSRQLLYQGDLDAEWCAYGTEDLKSIVSSFIAGINSYIDATGKAPALLPPEFHLLNMTPAPWKPEDLLRIRSHGLIRNSSSALRRAYLCSQGRTSIERLRKRIDPPTEFRFDQDCDSALLFDALSALELGKASVIFSAERLSARLEDASDWGGSKLRIVEAAEGSNNWAIHGSRTISGKPILASDPHRALTTPSTRYVVHLKCPEFDAIGAGEPCLPGIVIGHNDFCAFGLTFAPLDQEDVFIQEFAPNLSSQDSYEDRYEPIAKIGHVFEVKGFEDQHCELEFSKFGPVLAKDASGTRAVSLRTMCLEPGGVPYLSSLNFLRARSVSDFKNALASWVTPAANHVYADIDGNIARFTSAKVPCRSWSGLVPIPGDGRFEWDGFLQSADFDGEINPERAFVFSANEKNFSDHFLVKANIGFEWTDSCRAIRIAEMLAKDELHCTDASRLLQVDVFSPIAAQICALLPNEAMSDAVKLLQSWDNQFAPGSAEALLFDVWMKHFLTPAIKLRLEPSRPPKSSFPAIELQNILEFLKKPQSYGCNMSLTDRSELLRATLDEAFEAIAAEKLGTKEVWGDYHQAHFTHALSKSYDLPSVPIGGSDTTVMFMKSAATDGRVVSGASFRVVIDLSDWDNSGFVNAPGQSGDPRSAQYSDHISAWSAGNLFPLIYSASSVADACEMALRLVASSPQQ